MTGARRLRPSAPAADVASAAPPLLAIAHGNRDPRSAATIAALADAVRALRPGLRVEVGYLDHCAPTVGQVLDRLAADGERAVVALPLLLTAAYHSKTDVPAALHEAGARHPLLATCCGRTLGPDPLLRAALERRLAEAGVRPDPLTGIVLASAGSSDPAARAVIEAIAADWAQAGWAAVLPAYASAAEPDTARALARLRRLGVRRAVVASYFLAPGFLPDRVRLAAGPHVVSEPLGAAPELAQLVLSRYDETRASRQPLSA